MKYAKDKLNLEEGTKRDWIITNGLGGYAEWVMWRVQCLRD